MDQKYERENFKKLCRTCLLPREAMLSIFSFVEVGSLDFAKRPILDLLKDFTEISVSPNDGLPDNICGECLNEIHQTYTFKLKCENSDTILQQVKDDGKNLNELRNSQNENEEYSKTRIIKTEKKDVYEEILNSDHPDFCLPDGLEPESKQDSPLLQEVKQEPNIEIIMDDEDDNDENNGDEDGSKSDKRYYKCTICSKSFGRNGDLNRHMIVHTEERPFQCKICLQFFRFKHSLKNHMDTAHADNKSDSTFKCTICSSVFGREQYLARHMVNHTRAKPLLQCDICAQEFRHKHNLQRHVRTVHADTTMNNLRFECATCSKSFGRKEHMERHLRTHTGEKPYQCEVCPKIFRYKSNLKIHTQRKHTDNTVRGTRR